MIYREIACLAVLLMCSNPGVADASETVRNFLDGDRVTFSTGGHPKAKGTQFTVDYPSSWSADETHWPDTVQVFTSEGGHGLESMRIVIKRIPLPPGTMVTRLEKEEFFSPESMRRMIPPDAIFISAEPTAIETEPACMLEFSASADRGGIPLILHTRTLTLIQGHNLIQVHCSIGGLRPLADEAEGRMSEYRHLFSAMFDSVVLLDDSKPSLDLEYPSRQVSGSMVQLALDDPKLLALTLAVSFVITWTLGLTPPIIIRYAIVGRPLSRKSAAWIAFGFSAFYWIGFQALNNALGEEPGKGYVWIVMFFIARWILSRGHDTSLAVEPVASSALSDESGQRSAPRQQVQDTQE